VLFVHVCISASSKSLTAHSKQFIFQALQIVYTDTSIVYAHIWQFRISFCKKLKIWVLQWQKKKVIQITVKILYT